MTQTMVDPVALATARLRADLAVTAQCFEHDLPFPIEGTGTVMAAVRDGGIWGGGLDYHSTFKKVLTVILYADCSRTDDGLPMADDAGQRAWQAWAAIDESLNDVAHRWLAVVSSARQGAPSIYPLENSDLAVQLIGRFEVQI